MMKFAAIALVALIAVASAQDDFPGEEDSELSLVTTDDAEVAYLTPSTEIYRDFCISSRDRVFNDIKKNSNDVSSKVFSLFFDSAENLGRDALEVSKAGAERLSAQLANPDSPIAEPSSEAEQIIAQGQENIKSTQTQPMAFLEAMKTSIKAISQTVGSQFAKKIEGLKKFDDPRTIGSALQAACAAIEKYDKENKESFEKVKAELTAGKPGEQGVAFNQVQCLTTRRISRLDGICKLAVASKGPLQKIIGTFIYGVPLE